MKEVQGIDVKMVELGELLTSSDMVSLHLPHTDETHHLIGKEELGKMKESAYLVNCARGGVIDEDALYDVLKNQGIRGAALDVFEEEKELAHALRGKGNTKNPKIKSLSKLSEYPNVILTPHNAFNTAESVERKAEQSVQQLNHFLKHGKFLWQAPIA